MPSSSSSSSSSDNKFSGDLPSQIVRKRPDEVPSGDSDKVAQHLTLPKGLLGHDGGNIVRKSKTKKTTTMLWSLPMELSFFQTAQEGQDYELGTVESPKSDNPIIWLKFPGQGQLRLCGTVLHPKTRYMCIDYLKNGPSKNAKSSAKDVRLQHLFSSICVFNSYSWHAETDTPTNFTKLKLPDNLLTTPPKLSDGTESKYGYTRPPVHDFTAATARVEAMRSVTKKKRKLMESKTQQGDGDMVVKALKTNKGSKSPIKRAPVFYSGSSEEFSGADDVDDDSEEIIARSAPRRRSAVSVSYTERDVDELLGSASSSSSDSGSSDESTSDASMSDSDSESEGYTPSTTKTKKSPAKAVAKKKKKTPAAATKQDVKSSSQTKEAVKNKSVVKKKQDTTVIDLSGKSPSASPAAVKKVVRRNTAERKKKNRKLLVVSASSSSDDDISDSSAANDDISYDDFEDPYAHNPSSVSEQDDDSDFSG